MTKQTKKHIVANWLFPQTNHVTHTHTVLATVFQVNLGGRLLPLIFLIYFPKLCFLLRQASTVHIILTRVVALADARRRAHPSPPLPLIHHLLSLSYPSPSSSSLLFLFSFPPLGAAIGTGEALSVFQRGSERSPAVSAFLTNLTTENTSGATDLVNVKHDQSMSTVLLFLIIKLTGSNTISSLSSSLFFRSFSLT